MQQRSHGCQSAFFCLLVALLAFSRSTCRAKKTAYLLSTMQQSNPANDTYNSLADILQPPNSGVYDTIVLLANYTSMPGTQNLRVKDQNLTITSAGNSAYTFSFNFLAGVITLDNANITMRDMTSIKARRSSGQAVPYFQGNGMIQFINVVRFRLACASDTSIIFNNYLNSPRPAAFSGKQKLDYTDLRYNGVLYPNSIRLLDFAYFVGPADVEDFRMYAGYYFVQRNVTRACLSYIAEDCLLTDTADGCMNRAIDAYLAKEAAAAAGARQVNLTPVIVGPVVAGVAVVAAAIAGAILWRRRKQRKRADLSKVKLDGGFKQVLPLQQQTLMNSKDPDASPGCGRCCASTMFPPSHSGAAGTIEEVAFGSSGSSSKGWRVMASHTSPEFKDVTPQDKISLGVLLGAGSFGRVYKGRWRGLDVAVKVLQHDSTSAAAVANEVNLVMSFRHPNVTKAYHFVTWNHTGVRSDPASPRPDASAASAAEPQQSGNETSNSSSAAACKPGQGSSSGSSSSRCNHTLARLQLVSGSQQQQQRTSSNGLGMDADVHGGHSAASTVKSCSASELTGLATHSGFGTTLSSVPRNGIISNCSTAGCSCASDMLQDQSSCLEASGKSLLGPMATAQSASCLAVPIGAVRPALNPLQVVADGVVDIQQSDSWQQQLASPATLQQLLNQDRQVRQQQVLRQHSTPAGLLVQHMQSQDSAMQQYVPLVPAHVPAERLLSSPAVQQTGHVSITVGDLSPSGQQHIHQHQSPDGVAFSGPVGQQYQILSQHHQRSSNTSSSSRRGFTAGATEAQTWLILEFCDGGTLLDILESRQLISKSSGAVNMAHVLTLLCDIASGMLYLHSRNVLHGDLKPGNVLLKRQQGAPYGHQAKITDFGLSRSLKVGQSHRSTRTMGTVNHTPPELLRLGRVSPASDVYAFAIMMWELYTGKVAWAKMHYGEVFERVALLQERPAVPGDMPAEYAALMVACWHADPFQRPNFSDILDQLQQMLRCIVQEQQDAQERFVADL